MKNDILDNVDYFKYNEETSDADKSSDIFSYEYSDNNEDEKSRELLNDIFSSVENNKLSKKQLHFLKEKENDLRALNGEKFEQDDDDSKDVNVKILKMKR